MAEPDLIRNVLERAAKKWGIKHPMQTARLFSDWEAIVGEQIAAKCVPVAIKDGVLKIRTASAAWASEFRYLAPEVLGRINGELGADVVTEIRPSVDPSAGLETGREAAKSGYSGRRTGRGRSSRAKPGGGPA